jgi:peptidylprolyl isomerase
MRKTSKRWNKNWKVKDGHNVKVHYIGTYPDGSEFDNSRARGETLDFQIGTGKMIKGFNDAVVGMKKGQKKKVTLSPDNAYGARDETAIFEVPKNAFPSNFDFTVGNMVHGQTPDGRPLIAEILSLQKETVTLDHNHPLSGKDLTFEIELVDVE